MPDSEIEHPFLVDDNIPKFYANGFVTGLSNSDVVIRLQRNGGDVAILNLSYTSTKSLSVALGALITQLEQITKRTMLTSGEVDTAMKAEGLSPENLQ